MRVILFSVIAGGILARPVCAQDIAPDNVTAVLPWSGQIQTVNIQTRAVSALPKSEDGTHAKWSPNGRYAVFVTGRGEPSMRLYDTKAAATRVLGGSLTFPVAWREDSGRLAMFHRPATGSTELIQYGVGEKGITLRTNIAVMPNTGAPMVWLPNTDNVAYLGSDGNIYTVEEGEIHKVTTSNDVIGLALSREGKSLVWARRGPNLKYILVSFYLYDLTARSVKRMEFPGQVPGINPDPRHFPASIEGAVFSPDGTHVALRLTFDMKTPTLQTRAHPDAVYTVRMDGTGAKQVAGGGGPAAMTPFWSRDSRSLAVLRTGGPGNALLVSDADGATVTSVLGAPR